MAASKITKTAALAGESRFYGLAELVELAQPLRGPNFDVNSHLIEFDTDSSESDDENETEPESESLPD
eukprot:CAMPEP_0185572376 /NCGR_PEP_ID=MMETSP0434-20130131/4322_1 /TAXON_ID=626734 ORGANISM="Favella taraikaensis, Strain Fe Narragansett Bay" /NCGR_SAMPLE_ID=MMETSP0434 /ASSEMBLY_ACC=CAM_ASM_000379 /LENGTH=67 /DNA_ID=CAMNT_0028188231 /DNA_START=26 /DNA_END=229 /DNA_ORIENTATION=-